MTHLAYVDCSNLFIEEQKVSAEAKGLARSLKDASQRGMDGLFPARRAAQSALFAFIEGFCNRQRLHSTIGYKALTDMEQLAAAA